MQPGAGCKRGPQFSPRRRRNLALDAVEGPFIGKIRGVNGLGMTEPANEETRV